jgi:hypothetical protein
VKENLRLKHRPHARPHQRAVSKCVHGKEMEAYVEVFEPGDSGRHARKQIYGMVQRKEDYRRDGGNLDGYVQGMGWYDVACKKLRCVGAVINGRDV